MLNIRSHDVSWGLRVGISPKEGYPKYPKLVHSLLQELPTRLPHIFGNPQFSDLHQIRDRLSSAEPRALDQDSPESNKTLNPKP